MAKALQGSLSPWAKLFGALAGVLAEPGRPCPAPEDQPAEAAHA
jgi:hypothetical protein